MNSERISFCAYDTLCRIQVQTPLPHARAFGLLQRARDIAFEVQDCLSMFNPGSELSVLARDSVPGVFQRVSPMLYSFLEQNMEICRLTDGAFDPTVAPLVKLWDFLADEPRVPDDEALAAALGQVGYRHIRLDARTRRVCFARSGITVDPGAAGKGLAGCYPGPCRPRRRHRHGGAGRFGRGHILVVRALL